MNKTSAILQSSTLVIGRRNSISQTAASPVRCLLCKTTFSMTTIYKTHRTICFIINLLIVGLIICVVKTGNSDKSPVVFMVFYPFLFFINLLVFIVLYFLKSTYSKIYRQTTVGLFLLFMPLIFILASY